MPDRRPTLVLDLDGTLVDTAQDLTATLNAVLSSENRAPVTHDKAITMIGHGARAMLASAIESQNDEPEPEYLDRLFERFVIHYGEHIADHSVPFPGVAAALDRFADADWRLAVCTNKFEALSRSLLEQLGLADRFAAIAGQDTFAVRKPDPGHLTATIEQAGGDPRLAIMVGDSEVDVQAARAAGVPSVAVSFGYSRIPVAALGADAVIDHFDSLFEVASDLLKS